MTWMSHFAGALMEAVSEDSGAKHLIENSGACQLDCITDMIVSQVFPMQWGTRFVTMPNADKLATESMTGIIKACYPGADREKAKTFSEKLLQLVESFEKKTPKELQEAFAKVQKKMKDGDIKEARKCAASGNSGLEICEKP